MSCESCSQFDSPPLICYFTDKYGAPPALCVSMVVPALRCLEAFAESARMARLAETGAAAPVLEGGPGAPKPPPPPPPPPPAEMATTLFATIFAESNLGGAFFVCRRGHVGGKGGAGVAARFAAWVPPVPTARARALSPLPPTPTTTTTAHTRVNYRYYIRANPSSQLFDVLPCYLYGHMISPMRRHRITDAHRCDALRRGAFAFRTAPRPLPEWLVRRASCRALHASAARCRILHYRYVRRHTTVYRYYHFVRILLTMHDSLVPATTVS